MRAENDPDFCIVIWTVDLLNDLKGRSRLTLCHEDADPLGDLISEKNESIEEVLDSDCRRRGTEFEIPAVFL